MLPASILTEAMAQAGAVLILAKPENRVAPHLLHGHRPRALPAAGRRRATRCSSRARWCACAARWGACAGVARVDGKVVCEGQMTFALGRPAPVRGRRADAGGRPPSRPASSGPLSLARALSKFGVCSRTEAVRVDRGRPRARRRRASCAAPARRIDPRRDRVSVDGRPRGRRDASAWSSPSTSRSGYITTRDGPRRPAHRLRRSSATWAAGSSRWAASTATPPACSSSPTTTAWASGSPIPSTTCPKTYHARVAGVPDGEALRALREGVPLDDGTLTRPARVRALGARARAAATWLEIVLTEGKNRQVRRMCAAVGHEVLELVRVRIGGLGLGDLAPGEWRGSAREEVQSLRAAVRVS